MQSKLQSKLLWKACKNLWEGVFQEAKRIQQRKAKKFEQKEVILCDFVNKHLNLHKLFWQYLSIYD